MILDLAWPQQDRRLLGMACRVGKIGTLRLLCSGLWLAKNIELRGVCLPLATHRRVRPHEIPSTFIWRRRRLIGIVPILHLLRRKPSHHLLALSIINEIRKLFDAVDPFLQSTWTQLLHRFLLPLLFKKH